MFAALFGEEEEIVDRTGNLIVEIYAGRDITFGDTRKRPEGPQICNPFCILQLGKQKNIQTEVLMQTMNPQWQSRFEFTLEDLRDSAALLITCYHENMLGMKDMIGEVRIPVAEHRSVPFKHAVQHWYPLYNPHMKRKDGSCGELGLKIGCVTREGISEEDQIKDYDNASVEDIYREASILAAEANASAHRSLDMLEATREVGSVTLMKMKEQGAQIERMQDNMESMNTHMDYNDRKLRSIESVWGSLANKITAGGRAASSRKKVELDKKLIKQRKKDEKELMKMKEKQWEARREADKANSGINDVMLRRNGAVRVGHYGGQQVQTVGDNEEAFYAYVDDTDKTIDQIGYVLDDLKGLAIEMGNEVFEQNDRLVTLQDQIAVVNPKVQKATRRAQALANE